MPTIPTIGPLLRLVCREPVCATRTFTQQSTAVPARSRLTTRLREKIGTAIASGNRAVSEVAGEYRVVWATAHRALIVLAARWLPEPEPTRDLGIDETRARSARWVLEEAGWRRSDPWMRLLGLTPGRSGACVSSWLQMPLAPNERVSAVGDAGQARKGHELPGRERVRRPLGGEPVPVHR